MNRYFTFESPIGSIVVYEHCGCISRIAIDETPLCDAEHSKTPVIAQAVLQLHEYFNKKRTHFNLPLYQTGTEFQLKIWKALSDIPYGETCTYSELAEITGNSKAARAVGAACGANPLAIVVPCHRVVGKNGSLTGFAYGTDKKRKLLDLEAFETK